jgi:hypothetical protein
MINFRTGFELARCLAKLTSFGGMASRYPVDVRPLGVGNGWHLAKFALDFDLK